MRCPLRSAIVLFSDGGLALVLINFQYSCSMSSIFNFFNFFQMEQKTGLFGLDQTQASSAHAVFPNSLIEKLVRTSKEKYWQNAHSD